ncbi:alpha/beta hydrolase [Nocardia sp. NPDC051570]|uniref:alpha/beta hydrolase n=1 Tax=Nocardia sp. NPDC051570 TaxID=3364324 RepID=UPI0037941C5F
MPLDPAIEGFMKQLETDKTTITEKRVSNRLLTFAVSPRPPQAAGQVSGGMVAGVPVRMYHPTTPGPLPTVVYFHGGCFVYGDLNTHDQIGRRLSRDTGAVVVSVGYRLAPEHLYPAAHDDCLAVTRWVADHIDDYGGGNLAVAGDSAGANLAAAVALGFRDEGRALAGQLLAYANLDLSGRHYPSHDVGATGPFLNPVEAADFTELYLSSDPSARDHAPASPLLASNFAGLAPAVIATSEYDPVRDECFAYSDALTVAGVPVTLHDYPGLIHGFLSLVTISTAAADAAAEVYAEFAALIKV